MDNTISPQVIKEIPRNGCTVIQPDDILPFLHEAHVHKDRFDALAWLAAVQINKLIYKRGDPIYLVDPDLGWIANPESTGKAPYRAAIKVFTREVKPPCLHENVTEKSKYCDLCGVQIQRPAQAPNKPHTGPAKK